MADGGENRQSIGERLLALRNKNNLTQEELAERLMVSRQSVSKWELGKTLPDVDKLIQLSEMYEVSMDYLIIGKLSNANGDTEGENVHQSEGEQGNTNPQGNEDMTEDEAVRENEEKSGDEKAQGGAKKKSIDRLIRRSSLLMCMLLSGILCACLVFFSGKLLMAHAYSIDGKKQDLAWVKRVHEQYTKAEVTFLNDNGMFVNKNVWLDIPGVREDDYVYYYYDENVPNAYSFEYYMQTLLLPVIAGIICLIFFITFCMEWREAGKET